MKTPESQDQQKNQEPIKLEFATPEEAYEAYMLCAKQYANALKELAKK